MHQSTLKLKLSIMHLVKNIVHNNALYWPTTRQVPQAELLARSTSVTIWKQAEWESWCSELADVKKPCKAKLPLHEKRKEEAHLVRKRQMKKPSSGVKRKRTPLTLKRQDSLRRAGVRRPCRG